MVATSTKQRSRSRKDDGWKNRIVGHGEKPASHFTPHPNNFRNHPARQKSAVRGSLGSLGWIDEVIINKRTGHTIDGHERIDEALANEDAPVPYVEVDLTEEEEAQALLSLDPIAAMATTNRNNAAALLEQINTNNTEVMTFLTGFARDTGLDWGSDSDLSDGKEQIEKAEELRKKWKTKPGQVWQIGKHKIICADSTDRATYRELLKAERAALTFTDPPYGVDYESRATGTKIEGDNKRNNDLVNTLLRPALKNMMDYSQDTAGFYIFHASSTRRDFEWAMDAIGLEEKQYLVWVKEAFVLGHSDYRWQHEPFFYAQKAGHSAKFYGDRKQSTCWRIRARLTENSAVSIASGVMVSTGEHDEIFISARIPKLKKTRHIRMKPTESLLIEGNGTSTAWEIRRDSAKDYLHPTQKPTALAMKAIINSTLPGEIVLDGFLGGAGTLLAAEKTGRVCRGIDLDPKYIAVALERAKLEFPGIDVRRL